MLILLYLGGFVLNMSYGLTYFDAGRWGFMTFHLVLSYVCFSAFCWTWIVANKPHW